MTKPGYNTVDVNRNDLLILKNKYSKCKDGETFIFKGNEILKEYAKYMIEYIEGKFNEKPRS